jgi:hypothetical protein
MSFRQFGGLQFASKHNAVASNYNTTNNLLVTQNVGQPNSYITFLSDISGNITLYGDLDVSGNLNVGGDVDISGNLHVQKDIDCSGNVNIRGDVDISGNLHVQKNIDCSGNVTADYMFLSSQDNYTSNPWGVVPKKYIDDRVQGLIPLAACQCATTAFVDLNAVPPSSIDGYTIQTGDRVLVNYQSGTTPSLTNGIYVVNLTTSPYWTYASDWTGDTYRCTVNVLSGLQNGNKQFIQIQDPGIVSVNPILFEIFSSSDQAGRGLSTDFSGNTLYLNVDTSLNFVNFLDNSAGPDNINVLNLGTNTNNIYIGKVSGSNNKISVTTNSVGINNNNPSSSYVLDVSGNMRTTADALINNLTVGQGGGNVNYNTVVGHTALASNISGGNNTAIGNQALTTNNGFCNTALGGSSLIYNTNGAFNTAVGFNSGLHNMTYDCEFNTFLGYQADISNNAISPGYSKSTALGYSAIIDASNQIVLGTATEKVKIPGSYVGINGAYNPSSSYNLDVSGNMRTTADALINGLTVGRGSGNADNAAIGFWSLLNNTSGYYNTAIGNVSLESNTTGYENTAVGGGSLRQNISGNYNTAVGYNSLYFNTGNNNTAIGRWSLQNNTTGNNNTALGYNSLFSNNGTGSNNTAIGREAQYNTTTGGDNTSLGSVSLYSNTTGNFNVAIGREALRQNTTTSDNTAIGYYSLFNNTGGKNTAIGSNSGWHLNGNSNFNTFLGDHTDVPSGPLTYNYSTALGYNAIIDASNQIVLGGLNGVSYPSVKIPGSYVGIGGNYNPGNGYALDVNGSVYATTYNTPSDYRIKENVTQLDDKFVVDNLNPVTYLNKKSDKQDIGLIAHELQEIYPELVNGEKDGEEFQSVNYLGLIPILIKEIQELKKEIKLVKTELNELKNK